MESITEIERVVGILIMLLIPTIVLLSPFIFLRFVMYAITKKVRASHEPVAMLPTAPVHFCTQCGKPVAENAATCKACGAVPTGYRNFCCQCGVRLNPEQILCIRCGAAVASGMGASQHSPSPPGSDIRQIKDYFDEAIVDLFICLPLGIMAVVFSSRTLNAKKNNDYYGAVHYSKVTKRFVNAVRIIVATVVFIILAAVFVISVIGIMSSSNI